MFLTKSTAIAAALVLSGAVAGAQTQITSRGALTGATTITWDAAGANGTGVANPFTITTPIGDLTTSSTGGIKRLDAGSSWGSWGGGFSNGDNLLYTSNGDAFTFHFASPVTGFATQLWNDFPGEFAPTISLFNQGTFLATFSVVGSGGSAPNDNQAPVLGATYANGFDEVVIGSSTDFAVNQLSVVGVTTTPEPSSMALLGTGLVGLVPVIRRRRR